MECRECGAEMELRPGPYHYTASGLDNVYLGEEWARAYKCSCGEEAAEIRAPGKLLKMLGEELSKKPGRLNGKEVRFLRKEMRMRANRFAELVGMAPESLSRIENGHRKVSATLDRFVRMLYRFPDAMEGMAAMVALHQDTATGDDEPEGRYAFG